ncbi:MAG: biotin/lipoyl-binding protein [Oscillospiraceae bacterium]|nr:biotin/lipoyl-binding protein [Oscillospiraceae bacterium]
MEKKTKNRAWVKNAAIIFLAVLLVLTFFSNTILNRSLPEVSGQNAYGGEISTSVRGTGTVTANESYAVQLDRGRQIKSVLVRPGDYVEAGQVLFELEPSDSDELAAAIKQLEELRYNYNLSLLQTRPEDNRKEQLELQRLREALQEAVDKKDKIVQFVPALDAAKAALDAAQEKVEALDEEIAEINDQLSGVSSATTAEEREKLEKLQKDVENAQAYVSDAQDEADYAQQMYHAAVSANGAYQAASEAELAALANAKTLLVGQFTATPPTEADGAGVPGLWTSYQTSGLTTEQENGIMRAILVIRKDGSIAATGAAETTWRAKYNERQQAGSNSTNLNLTQLQNDMERANMNVVSANSGLKTAQKALEDYQKQISKIGEKEKEELTAKLKTKTLAQKEATREATRVKDALTKVQEDAGLTTPGVPATLTPEQAIRQAEADIKTAQTTLENRMIDFEIEQGGQGNEAAIRELERQKARDGIAEQERLVEEMREKETGTEVKTRYGGTVLSVDTFAGAKVEANMPLATVEVNGKGFMLSFSVTNEETRRVRIGDIARISSWGMEDIVCTLVAIKTDRENPTRKKVLEFDVTGYVTAGQNLELSVGARTQYYENVVPNSAIREDSDGKFVLIAKQKPTPLGNRYIATRVDIDVIDSDSKSTAIRGDFEWAPYVITTSSKPIVANTQVRLVG